jgi:SAM-dependent methyltransferase
MTAGISTRSRFQGVTQIIRFNWRMYAAGLLTLAIVGAVLPAIALPKWMALLLILGTVFAVGWLLMSVVVSYVVYDLSPLCRWTWLADVSKNPLRIANIHAGFDEASATIRRLFVDAELRVLDIFDPREMTEPSIAVARSVPQEVPAETADFRCLPLADASSDLVTLLLAAHELRSAEARIAFLREVRRALAPKGRVVLAEHLRDLPNFLAFGPGFTHFHSRRTWLANARAAGLMLVDERRITPFVRIFTFERSNP